MKKKTITVPNRSYTSSADGHLPKVPVSVSMPPWEEKDDVLGYSDHHVRVSVAGERIVHRNPVAGRVRGDDGHDVRPADLGDARLDAAVPVDKRADEDRATDASPAKPELKVLDLFSGIGGFTLGLERTGHYRTVAFCENDPASRKVLSKHWPDLPIIDDVRDTAALAEIGADVLTGGFPCQDISIAGKNEGIDGEKSGLWAAYREAIAAVRPRFAIVENVFALRSRGLHRVLGDLACIGYDAAYTLFDTQYFGLPQRRRRVYIVAVRDGIPAATDLFDCAGRSGPYAARWVKDFAERREGYLAEVAGERSAFAFCSRLRSDCFAESAVSGTLAKRDHKSYTDLVIHRDGTVRRVMPHERMRLQGFPEDWLDGLDLKLADQFRLNGMSVPVVSHIGKLIHEKLV